MNDPAEPDVGGDTPGVATSDGSASGAAGRGGSARKRWMNKWSRTIHVYTSMIALLAILLFGFSGLTLNHPSWTFGDRTDRQTFEGTLPIPTIRQDGSVDFLSISEYVRSEYGVSGTVDAFDEVNGEGSIAYRNAGYSADLFFAVDSGKFTLSIEQQGWVGVMNDLHKGRNTRSMWNLVIDIVAVFLMVVSVTGLMMQFFLRKRRRSALLSAAVGVVLLLVLIFVTLR